MGEEVPLELWSPSVTWRTTRRRAIETPLVLLLPFASAQKRKAIESIAVRDLSADLLKRFLNHLENARSCSIRTRNQRLAAYTPWHVLLPSAALKHRSVRTVSCMSPSNRHGRTELLIST